jgi:predicted HD superfamily hydrolase involved in NAD metabolism
MNLEQIKEEVKQILSEERFIHSMGVMERAEELASIHGENVEVAKLVGITHDIAKELSKEEIENYIKENNIEVDEIEKKQPYLLHGKIGADMCGKKYNFNEYMKRAIAIHTTGDRNMTKLDKIVFLADKTEKNRPFEDIKEAIEICNKSLDEGMIYCLNIAIKQNIDRKRLIHPNTIITRNDIMMNL